MSAAASPVMLDRLRAVRDVTSDRLVVITLRDLGMTNAANIGVFDVLGRVAATASVAVPCPWARDASVRHQQAGATADIGVQLTLNAQHAVYRWGPVTLSPSLVDGNGGFPMTVGDLWDHADLDEVRRECRSQIERALSWGIDVSHLSSHLDALTLRAEFFDVLLDLGVEFDLPVSLPDAEASERAGFPLRDLATEEGILFPDHVVNLMHAAPTPSSLADVFASLAPGVTELRFSPAIDTPELRALSAEWANEVAQHDSFVSVDVASIASDTGCELITFRALRDAQRNR